MILFLRRLISYFGSGARSEIEFYVQRAQKREVKVAISNTFGFGGHNACVVIKKIITTKFFRAVIRQIIQSIRLYLNRKGEVLWIVYSQIGFVPNNKSLYRLALLHKSASKMTSKGLCSITNVWSFRRCRLRSYCR